MWCSHPSVSASLAKTWTLLGNPQTGVLQEAALEPSTPCVPLWASLQRGSPYFSQSPEGPGIWEGKAVSMITVLKSFARLSWAEDAKQDTASRPHNGWVPTPAGSGKQ